MYQALLAAIVTTLCLLHAQSARADSIRVGITTALATGSTDNGADAVAVPKLPVPLLNIRMPWRRFELFDEPLPPIPQVAGSAICGHRAGAG